MLIIKAFVAVFGFGGIMVLCNSDFLKGWRWKTPYKTQQTPYKTQQTPYKTQQPPKPSIVGFLEYIELCINSIF